MPQLQVSVGDEDEDELWLPALVKGRAAAEGPNYVVRMLQV